MTISLSFGEAPVRGKRNGLGPQECFNVTIVGDVLVEYDETFELRLSSTDPDVVLMPNSTVVNIVNDDYANVTLQLEEYNVLEGYDTQATVCSELTAGLLERGVSVALSTSDLTALAGEDYDAVAMFQMDYEPNSPLNSVRCVNITIRDDLIVEPDQFFQVALTTSDPVFLTPISMATVVIATDNDTANVTLDQEAYLVSEFDLFEMVCAELVEGELQRDITVYLSTSDGTAFDVDDYLAVSSYPLVFMSGDPLNTLRCLNVSIVNDDDVIEPDQSFFVSLTSSDPVYIAPFAESAVTIQDNDVAIVSLTMELYEAEEGEGNATVCAELLDGVLERNISVYLSTDDITAIAPGDYGAVVNAPLDFHVGEELNTTSCVDIDIFDDDTVEYEELFSVSLMTTDPVIIVPISEANVSIFDNDDAVVTLVASTLSVDEFAGYVAVCANLTDGVLERMITVYFTTLNGSALDGSDYEGLTSVDATFLPGDPVGTVVCVNVTIINDVDVIEPDQTFSVLLTSSAPVIIEPISEVAITILDDDVANISLTSMSYQANEFEVAQACAILVFGILERNITGYLSTQDLSAVAPDDYMAIMNEPVQFMPGDVAGSTEDCVPLVIVDDSAVEFDEIFEVVLTSSDPAVYVSQPDMANVTILDDDVLSVSWEQVLYMVSESGGPATVCAEIVDGSLQRDVAVAVSALSGTAIAGLDFSDDIQPIVLTSGLGVGGVACTQVDIFSDATAEQEESFQLALESNELALAVPPNITTVVIAEAEIGFNQTEYIVGEGESFTVCLELTGGLQSPVDVNVTIVEGTAQGGGVDYTFVPQTVTFDGMLSVMCFDVDTTQDFIYETDEFFSLVLSTDDPTLSLSPSEANLTIIDNDDVNLAIVNSTMLVVEGEGMAEICISINVAVEPTITVSINAMSGSATVGEDFLLVDDIMFTENGASVMCVPITIVDDLVPENCAEVFGVTVTSDDVRVNDAPGMAMIQIDDDDEVEFCFVNDTPMITGANLTVEFELRGCATVTCETTTTSQVDCTPVLGSTSGDYSVFDLPVQLNAGHILTVTVMPAATGAETQIFEREFRTDNSQRCGVVFINKAVTIDLVNDIMSVEFAGTGPGMLPEDTVSEFTCNFNNIGPRNCTSPFEVPLDDPDIEFGLNEIGVRPNDLTVGCSQQRINRFSFDFIVDPVTVSLQQSEYVVDEGSGFVEVCAELTDGVVERMVEILFNTSDGTAMASTDYLPVSSASFVFSAGGGTVSCVNVSIVDDVIVEGNQTFSISLSSSDPVTFDPVQEASITIIDNDGTTASLEQDSYALIEGTTDSVCVTLPSAAERTITVSLSTSNGTAFAPDDYIALSSEPVEFSPGTVLQCSPIVALSDDLDELTEMFFVSLFSEDPAVMISPIQMATVNITDPAQALSINISAFTANVNENDGVAEVCVLLNGEVVGSPVEFSLLIDNNTALLGEDFVEESITSMFVAGGAQEICLNISIINDATAENCLESFFVTLVSSDAIVEPLFTIEIGITDDDEPVFCFINNTPHVEGDVLELELQLLGCATLTCDDPDQPFSTDCTPSLGSTTSEVSISGLTQINNGGHTLTVTVDPTDTVFPQQTIERRFRTDNSARCSVIFINKGVSVDNGMVTVEWEGNGPGISPGDTANAFDCEINGNAARPCTSPFMVPTSDADFINPGVNQIAVRPDPSFGAVCSRRNRNRIDVVLP